MTRAKWRWSKRSLLHATVPCATGSLRCSVSRSSPTRMTCVRRQVWSSCLRSCHAGHAYAPLTRREWRKLMPGFKTADDPFSCIAGADAMVILTEWDQFRALDLDRIKALLRSPLVVDLRNVYKPAPMAEKGFAYVSIGRNDIPLPSKPGVP